MEKLKFNPDNKKYYSEEFIKGFECGVERQFNADMEEKTAEWIIKHKITNSGSFWEIKCSNCGIESDSIYRYCPYCGAKMKRESEEEE